MITIIPAIDIIGGRCVRLTRGDYNFVKEYSANPVEVAVSFERAGVKRLHIVDLDGAKASEPQNLSVLKKIAQKTSLKIEFGGGIKSKEALEKAFEAGATYAILGSVAVQRPKECAEWITRYGAKIILGIDLKKGLAATDGWQKVSSESAQALIDRYAPLGVKEVICTDISRDGMLQGPNTELYTRLQHDNPNLTVIASGGISSVGDVQLLENKGLRAVIIGKAIYEGRIELTKEAIAALRSRSRKNSPIH